MRHISLMQPFVPPSAIPAVTKVLKSRWIAEGPVVKEFEQQFTKLVGKPAIAVGSCTDALHLAYILAGIGPGDEVIAPLFTCTATNVPLLWQGAKIRFYDVAPNSLNGDMKTILDMMTENTKAIVIVHYGGAHIHGYGAYMPPNSYPVIEDAAQALGAKFLGNADYSCYSFQAVKHVTTGDGGMLLCPFPQIEEARRRRWFGIDREAKHAGTWENDIKELGYKYQLNDVGAAMGIAGLKSLDMQITYRTQLMEVYKTFLQSIPGIEIIDADPNGAHWLCTVSVQNRDGLIKKLAERSIESGQAHYRNDRYTIFEKFKGEFPIMDAIEGKYLCLPLHMHLTAEDAAFVCDVIRSGW